MSNNDDNDGIFAVLFVIFALLTIVLLIVNLKS